jgi:hypothetical protein
VLSRSNQNECYNRSSLLGRRLWASGRRDYKGPFDGSVVFTKDDHDLGIDLDVVD